MKKIILSLFLGLLLLAISALPAKAATLLDDFNDGNADGWWLGYSLPFPSIPGNWRVVDGTLIQDNGYDGTIALLNNFQISDQTVEVRLKLIGPSGGAAIQIWFQNYNNAVGVGIRSGAIGVSEVVDGVWYVTDYPFNFNINENRWVNLKVEANSTNGDLNVYADGAYFATHHLVTSHRTGQSGIVTGNAGAYFDDFILSSNDIPPAIDIKPWDNTNIINLKGLKKKLIAILSATNFLTPSQVDRTTLTFGKTGDENSLLSCDKRPKDLNRDGLPDLVCTFAVNLTGFQCGDTKGILKGKINKTGMSFETSQKVRIIPCK